MSSSESSFGLNVDLNDARKAVELAEANGFVLGAYDAYSKVREFHEAFGHPVVDGPTLVSVEDYLLRYDLILEELYEYLDASQSGDLVEVADALTDLLYVVLGGFLIHGLDPVPLFEEVHRSNMSKLDADGKPVPHPDVPGKIGKSDLYSPPDLGIVLYDQGWPGETEED